MKKLLVYYNSLVATIFVLLALFNARTVAELAMGVLFSPLLIYFVLTVLSQKNHVTLITIKKKTMVAQKVIGNELSSIKMPKLDMDRRLFLKLIASGGISLFLLALFTRKAEKAFLGSAINPSTAELKDITDGYQIAEIDDSIPTYYGYINKDGAWFIRKEDANGSFRYTKGESNFPANWANRASLTYHYFDTIF